MTSLPVTQRPFQQNGAKIKRARESVPSPRDSRRPISHQDFAPKVGCTPRHLIRLEKGEQRPSPELRNRIVEVTGTEEQIEADGYEDEEDAVRDLRDALGRIQRKRLETGDPRAVCA